MIGVAEMKYTKEQLQGMNSAEINIALAGAIGFELVQRSMKDIGKMWVIEDANGELHRIPDYCNNPSDIMPLAFKYKIGVMNCYSNDLWKSRDSEGEFEVFDSKPLRAIACCLILVLQEQSK